MQHFLGGFRKSLELQASKKFNNKYSENSTSQIVFPTDIFQNVSWGTPEVALHFARGSKSTDSNGYQLHVLVSSPTL